MPSLRAVPPYFVREVPRVWGGAGGSRLCSRPSTPLRGAESGKQLSVSRKHILPYLKIAICTNMVNAMNPRPKKVAVTFTIDPDVLQEFQTWLDRQSIRPSKTAVVEAALREFLKRQKTKERR